MHPPQLSKQTLDELVYERTRIRIALRQLRAFDADLRRSIARTLDTLSESKDERDDLALASVDLAWKRVAADMETGVTAMLEA